jgi:pimeloyl-ACP methyl ester carboxylesterase
MHLCLKNYSLKKTCCLEFTKDKAMVPGLADLPGRTIYKDTQSNRRISYRRQEPVGITGEPPTLVFLHGFNGNSASWHYQFTHFLTFRVISIDAPGFGETSVFEGGMAGFAEEVASMLSNLNLPSFWLIGHSMGGMLAQVIASQNRHHCAGLILSCTHKGRARPESEPLSEDVQSRIDQRMRLNDLEYGTLRIERMLSATLSSELHEFLVSIAGDIRVEGIRWGGVAMQHLDTTPYLSNIECPTLILSAQDDIVIKPDALQALISDLPNAERIEMAGVGHAPYCEDADGFNSLVEQFILRHSNA